MLTFLEDAWHKEGGAAMADTTWRAKALAGRNGSGGEPQKQSGMYWGNHPDGFLKHTRLYCRYHLDGFSNTIQMVFPKHAGLFCGFRRVRH
jgi:hypothetical protein